MITIKKDEIYRKYRIINSSGDEGNIFSYDDKHVIKIYKDYRGGEKSELRINKINVFSKIKDDSFCFPLELVLTDNNREYGYLMDYVEKHPEYNDFFYLRKHYNFEKKIKFIMQANNALERVHKLGMIVGDIKDDNIMIDKEEKVKYVDTCVYKIGEYGHDISLYREKCLRRTFPNSFPSDIDNDKFVFGMMCFQYYLKETEIFKHMNEEYFKKLMVLIEVDKEVRDGLSIIFSDANNKPYIGPILEKIDLNQNILPTEKVKILHNKK